MDHDASLLRENGHEAGFALLGGGVGDPGMNGVGFGVERELFWGAVLLELVDAQQGLAAVQRHELQVAIAVEIESCEVEGLLGGLQGVDPYIHVQG